MGRHFEHVVLSGYLQQAVTNGKVLTLPLRQIPTKGPRGGEVRIKRFRIRIPKPTITIAAGKAIDRCTIGQLCSTFNLRMAGKNPFKTSEQGMYLWQTLQLHEIMDVLAWMTDECCVQIGGNEIRQALKGAADSTTLLSLRALSGQDDTPGWNQFSASLGDDGGGGGATWTDDVWLIIPFVRRGESTERGIPAYVFSGDCGCGGEGQFEIAMSTSVDAQTAAFGTDGFDIIADCYEADPDADAMVPIIPRLVKDSGSNRIFDLDIDGKLDFLALQKDLSSGDQVAVDVTTAYLTENGVDLADPEGNMLRHQRALASLVGRHRPGRRFAIPQAVTTLGSDVNKARLLRHPLFGFLGSDSLRSLPNAKHVKYRITSATDTTFQYIAGTWDAGDAETVERVRSITGAKGSVEAITRNGNKTSDPQTIAALPKQIALASAVP